MLTRLQPIFLLADLKSLQSLNPGVPDCLVFTIFSFRLDSVVTSSTESPLTSLRSGDVPAAVNNSTYHISSPNSLPGTMHITCIFSFNLPHIPKRWVLIMIITSDEEMEALSANKL